MAGQGVSPYNYPLITELFRPSKGGTPVWYDEAYRRFGGGRCHWAEGGRFIRRGRGMGEAS
ncbi:MAG TPA: hypothetical protein VN418_02565 [Gammaproteobacteria bacterium]|nr:hypothetical protein [Gammaproteobacteria bacterium]